MSVALELAVGQHPHLMLVAGLLPPTHDPVPAPACALVMRDMAGGDARACWQRYVLLLAVRLCLLAAADHQPACNVPIPHTPLPPQVVQCTAHQRARQAAQLVEHGSGGRIGACRHALCRLGPPGPED